jgi:hypothetical protein
MSASLYTEPGRLACSSDRAPEYAILSAIQLLQQEIERSVFSSNAFFPEINRVIHFGSGWKSLRLGYDCINVFTPPKEGARRALVYQIVGNEVAFKGCYSVPESCFSLVMQAEEKAAQQVKQQRAAARMSLALSGKKLLGLFGEKNQPKRQIFSEIKNTQK